MYRWGLIPFWVKDESTFKANTLNARTEELFEKISYKNSWNKRCLLICTGFFEPHYPEGFKKSQSYYIKPKVQEFFTLDGIWSKWNDIFTSVSPWWKEAPCLPKSIMKRNGCL